MRIGIDARLWNESGVGRYIRNLVSQLAEIDKVNEYVLFVRKEIQNSEFRIQNDNLKFKNNKWRIIETDIRWHTMEEQLKFPSVLNEENLDLMHFPYFSVPIFYNKPFVVTIHDLILHHFPTGEASTLPLSLYTLKLLGYRFIIKQAAKHAKKIITVSNATKQEIIDHLHVDEDKVVVTHEGVDLQNSNKSQPTTYNLQPTTYFLYVGNAYPHKNLERLIEAFAGIRNQESGIKLVLVGKEDYFYKRLKEKVKKIGLEKQIVFYGFATDEELTNLYKNAKALIMPSLMEGFGLPVLEAMANKCLVLTSNIPVHHEIAGDAAIYFDPKNHYDLTAKMEYVLKSPKEQFNKNIVDGKKQASHFLWEQMAKETLGVYTEVLSKT